MDIIQAFLLGIAAGTFAGLMPGVPLLMGFMLFLPLVPIDAFSLTLYAMVMGLGTQFFGSQAVLYYRVPGESSSFPTLMEAHNFNTPEKIREAVQVTTWGSLVAAVIATLALTLALTTGMLDWVRLPIEVKGTVFALLIILCILSSKPYWTNTVALAIASFFAFYEDIAPLTDFLPTYYFNSMLSLIIIFAFQLVWQKPDEVTTEVIAGNKSNFDFKQWWPTYFKYGSIGTMFGIVPHLGSTLSSYAAYTWEKTRSGPMKRIAAAETTNNGAMVFHWLPLFLFGVPITGSEIMLVSTFDQFGLYFTFLKTQAHWLMLLVLLSAFVYTYLCLATNKVFYKTLGKLISNKLFSVSLAFVSLGLFYIIGGYSSDFMLIHLMVFVPVSWIVHKLQVSMLAVTVGMLLMNQVLFTFYQLSQLYIY